MPSQDLALLRRLLRAKDRMDAASHEEWPVERLASVSGVSEAHFARSFKDAFGVPPHRYLLTRRIERAKALLRDTDMTIIDIMMETGWQSLGTFGRVFRDITGESPTELRAPLRQKSFVISRLYSDPRVLAGIVIVLDFAHLGDQIGEFDDLGMGAPTGEDQFR
jgi:transcriptional regulator GlxA family with amidase domain